MQKAPALRRGFASAKRFIALAAASALVVGAGATMAHAVPSQAKPKVPAGEIEFHHWRLEDKDVLDQLILRFQNQNPGVKITQVISPTTTYRANAFQQLRNNPKGAAITALRGPQFWQFASGGLFKDVSSEAFVKNVNPNSLNAGKLTGKQYGVPYQHLFNMPVYNTEIFRTVGIKPPTTFPQFLDMCRKLKTAGYIPMVIMGSVRGQAGQISQSFLAQEATDSQISQLSFGKTKVTDPWFRNIAGKYEEMRNAGCFQDNPLGTTEPAALALFAQGRAAILPTGTFSMGAVKRLNPDMEGKMQLLFPVSKTNAKDAVFEGVHNNTFILGINSTSSPTQQAIARAWIDFLTKPANAEYYANGTSQHAVVSGVKYTNPDLKNTAQWLTKNTKLAPRFLIFNGGVEDEVVDLLTSIVGGKSPDAAIAEFAPRIAAKTWN